MESEKEKKCLLPEMRHSASTTLKRGGGGFIESSCSRRISSFINR